MKIGAWFDLRNPPGWRQSWEDHYAFTLEMCEEAERVGLSSVWFSEHHGFEDGYLPQPLTFAAAVAARTRRVRIGTAILIAPLRAPAQLAEEAALVDILSNGRLDLGIGAGYRVPEYDLFGADMDSRFKVLDARAVEIRELWASGRVTPGPVQPDLPIWMGYHGAVGARRTGRNGNRLLTVDPAVWPAYRQGLEEGGHPPSRGIMSGAIGGHVTLNPDRQDGNPADRPGCPARQWPAPSDQRRLPHRQPGRVGPACANISPGCRSIRCSSLPQPRACRARRSPAMSPRSASYSA